MCDGNTQQGNAPPVCCSLIEEEAKKLKGEADLACGTWVPRGCEIYNKCLINKNIIEGLFSCSRYVPPDSRQKCEGLQSCTRGKCDYFWVEELESCLTIIQECPEFIPDKGGWGCGDQKYWLSNFEENCKDAKVKYNRLKDLYQKNGCGTLEDLPEYPPCVRDG
ncbi:hypothetical protein AUJ84_03710 [Candidatus Pacearchaeota archaeon CG1_02_32_132]|nr:MAG: hypothetical protein AUJ84_03710 [Candidatus Pacearchaeota archaeon CG1_02_32_132]